MIRRSLLGDGTDPGLRVPESRDVWENTKPHRPLSLRPHGGGVPRDFLQCGPTPRLPRPTPPATTIAPLLRPSPRDPLVGPPPASHPRRPVDQSSPDLPDDLRRRRRTGGSRPHPSVVLGGGSSSGREGTRTGGRTRRRSGRTTMVPLRPRRRYSRPDTFPSG